MPRTAEQKERRRLAYADDPQARLEQLARNRRLIARNKEIVAAEAKRRGDKCERCKKAISADERHFHHRDPENKTTTVSGLATRTHSAARVVAELAKCVMVCIDCHHAVHEDFGPHRNRAKTHCHNGHEFTPSNTLITRRGTRRCRRCHTDRQIEYDARARASAAC